MNVKKQRHLHNHLTARAVRRDSMRLLKGPGQAVKDVMKGKTYTGETRHVRDLG